MPGILFCVTQFILKNLFSQKHGRGAGNSRLRTPLGRLIVNWKEELFTYGKGDVANEKAL